MDNRPVTVFLDIDGTLIHHYGNQGSQLVCEPLALAGTIDKLNEWDRLGYNIILVTGRKQSTRSITEKQLTDLGIFYDQLIMGVGGGVRVLINDKKNGSDKPTALAFSPDRNHGVADIEI